MGPDSKCTHGEVPGGVIPPKGAELCSHCHNVPCRLKVLVLQVPVLFERKVPPLLTSSLLRMLLQNAFLQVLCPQKL